MPIDRPLSLFFFSPRTTFDSAKFETSFHATLRYCFTCLERGDLSRNSKRHSSLTTRPPFASLSPPFSIPFCSLFPVTSRRSSMGPGVLFFFVSSSRFSLTLLRVQELGRPSMVSQDRISWDQDPSSSLSFLLCFIARFPRFDLSTRRRDSSRGIASTSVPGVVVQGAGNTRHVSRDRRAIAPGVYANTSREISRRVPSARIYFIPRLRTASCSKGFRVLFLRE